MVGNYMAIQIGSQTRLFSFNAQRHFFSDCWYFTRAILRTSAALTSIQLLCSCKNSRSIYVYSESNFNYSIEDRIN